MQVIYILAGIPTAKISLYTINERTGFEKILAEAPLLVEEKQIIMSDQAEY